MDQRSQCNLHDLIAKHNEEALDKIVIVEKLNREIERIN